MQRVTTEPDLIDRIVNYVDATTPFTWRLGVARTLLALSTALTLLFTPNEALYFGGSAAGPSVTCNGILRSITLACVNDDASWLAFAKVIEVGILIVVMTGFLPRWTAIPHWYVALSHTTNVTLVDGGDHINLMLVSILLPACLADPRLNHWRAGTTRPARFVAKAAASASILLAGIQMSVVYVIAAMSKTHVSEWADGTALWYWLSDSGFGLPTWLFDFATPLMSLLPVMAGMTYGVIAVELLAAGAIFYSARWRQLVFALMIVFHLLIAIVMGLWSFGLSMSAGLIIYLLRPNEPWAPALLPGSIGRSSNRREIGEPAQTPGPARVDVVQS